MKLIINGITCESDDNCNSAAPRLTFASISDAMCFVNGEMECGYCAKSYHCIVKETVNGKLACPKCRRRMIPPNVAYVDRHKRMWIDRK